MFRHIQIKYNTKAYAENVDCNCAKYGQEGEFRCICANEGKYKRSESQEYAEDDRRPVEQQLDRENILCNLSYPVSKNLPAKMSD